MRRRLRRHWLKNKAVYVSRFVFLIIFRSFFSFTLKGMPDAEFQMIHCDDETKVGGEEVVNFVGAASSLVILVSVSQFTSRHLFGTNNSK